MFIKWLRKKLFYKAGKKLPLKHPPLRLPGQRLRDEFAERIDNVFFLLATPLISFVIVLVILMVKMEHFSLTAIVLRVLISCASALVIAAISHPFFKKQRAELQDYYLGMLAESYVGQQLERCRDFGSSVFHDIQQNVNGTTFNIDHLVIGTFGIAVVETKGRSKPLRGETKLWAKNDKIQFLDGSYTYEPLKQVRANARCIQEIIYEIVRDAGSQLFNFRRPEEVPVLPIICYPGWFVNHKISDCKDVLISHEKPLISRLRTSKSIWSREQVINLSQLVGEHLRKDRRNLLFE